MQSKNKTPPTRIEASYVGEVAELACSVCDVPGPSEVHEIEQGKWFLSMALCADCHRGGFAGLHGQRRAWIGRKLTELDALAITIRRIFERRLK